MAKKPIKREEKTTSAKAMLRKIRPQPGDVVIIRGAPQHIDPEGFARNAHQSGIVPDGVGFLFIPTGVDAELMTEEMFNSLGYYRREDIVNIPLYRELVRIAATQPWVKDPDGDDALVCGYCSVRWQGYSEEPDHELDCPYEPALELWQSWQAEEEE